MTQDEAKQLVAKRATEFVREGMVVGLGTGTTATMFIRELAKLKPAIRCVASSDASHELGASLGLQVHTLAELPELDLYIDGADEVCAQCGEADGTGLNLIKGGGGALLREKIVASAAREFICVVDSTKVVEYLGKFPLPVEVIQMALPLVEPKLDDLGLNPKLRLAKSMPQGLKPPISLVAGSAKAEALAYPEAGAPFITDEGNFILDCHCGRIAEPESLAAELKSIVGVVEHGLFLGMASLALVAGDDGVKELRA